MEVDSSYNSSAAHNKTLNVIGRTKKIDDITSDELRQYCQMIIDEEFTAFSAEDIAFELMKRFKWNVKNRMNEIEVVWNNNSKYEFSQNTEEDPLQFISQQSTDVVESKMPEVDSKISNSSTIPVIIKPGILNKPFLLCECEDSELNFDGDAGAIGRVFVKDEKLSFDLKGRLYRGSIKVGPTILILNMAPPVGVTSSDYNQNARIEYLTNEYTQLTFEKDLLTELKGNYTGSYELTDEIEDFPMDKYERASLKKKKNKENEEFSDDGGDEIVGSEKKKSKIPKISAGRTQNMRGKDGKVKKKSKKIKQKKVKK